MTTKPATAADVAQTLAAAGWVRVWKDTNVMRDQDDNIAHVSTDDNAIRVEFENAAAGLVETLNLAADTGTRRIAAVIQALATT